MKAITQLNALPPPFKIIPVLAQNGLNGSLLTLDPGAEVTLPAGRPTDDQFLFVIEGGITVSSADVTTFIDRDGTALLPARASRVVTNAGKSPSRFLRLDIPAQPPASPELITLQP